MKSVRGRIALGLASGETATVAWDRARAARESGREPAFGTRPEATRGPGGEGISKVIKNGTVATADRAWKADVAFHAAVETGGVVG